MARAENVDVSRAQCKANTFHFFYGAARACLLPFLSVYFRYLGLSALQTGVVVAAQAWAATLFSPFWTRCAFGCSKKKFVLVCALLALIASYLLLTVIPPVNKGAQCDVIPANASTVSMVTVTSQQASPGGVAPSSPGPPVPGPPAPGPPSPRPAPLLTAEDRAELARFGVYTEGKTDAALVAELRALLARMNMKGVADLTDAELAHVLRQYFKDSDDVTENTHARTEEPTKHEHRRVHTTTTPSSDGDGDGVDTSGMAFFNRQSPDLRAFLYKEHGVTAEDFRGESEADTKAALLALIHADTEDAGGRHRRAAQTEESEDDVTREKSEETPEAGHHDNSSGPSTTTTTAKTTTPPDEPDLLEKTVAELRRLLQSVLRMREQVFAAVLVVAVCGAVFGAPVERLADCVWFEFLDCVDRLELYGGHRLCGTVGALLFPAALGAAVAYTPCLLPLHTHHILLHVYAFVALAAPAFILAFSFPVAESSRKVKRTSRLCKGLRMVCGGAHQTLFTLSAVLLGATHGLTLTFLFWVLQDRAGRHAHAYMGAAVAVAALSELVVRLFLKGLIRRLTNAGAVVLGLFVLGARLLLYSFLWFPWVALVGESLHALSHTLVLAAVETHQDFRLNPLAMDRSASAALTFLYHGLGVGLGALVSALLYDVVGAPVLFQGACVLTVVWSFLFAILHKCCRKPAKLRYTKLLQEDNDSSDESEVAYEDDWLEVALKHKE